MSEIELDAIATSRYIDPTIIRMASIDCAVERDGVSIAYEHGDLNYKLRSPLAPKTELIAINSDKGFRFYPKQAYLEQQVAQREKRTEKTSVANDKNLQPSKSKIDTNLGLRIPVKWSVVYKVVLSGLLSGFNGDGINKRSVKHIKLHEDVTRGLLVRKAGDILCGAPSGSFDTREAEGGVTCRKCLDVALRWKPEQTESNQVVISNQSDSLPDTLSLDELLEG